MREKVKFVMGNWMLDYVDQLADDYNEKAELMLDTDEMLEKCIVEAADDIMGSLFRITKYVIHGNCLSMEALEDFTQYMDNLEKKISGWARDCLYYEDEPLKIIQQNKNTLYKLMYYNRNHIYHEPKEMPELSEIKRKRMIPRRKKYTFNFQYTTKMKLTCFEKIGRDLAKEYNNKEVDMDHPVELLILHAYEIYINKDYYSYLKLPLAIMEVEDILAFKALIDKYSEKYLKEENVDEALIKTLEGMKERVKIDKDLVEQANADEEIKKNVYPFQVIMDNQRGI